MDPADWLPFLLGTATLLPLISFFAILVFGTKMGKAGVCAGYLAIAAIGGAALCSFIALFAFWLPNHTLLGAKHESHTQHAGPALDASQTLVVRGQSHEEEHADEGPSGEEHHAGEEEVDGLKGARSQNYAECAPTRCGCALEQYLTPTEVGKSLHALCSIVDFSIRHLFTPARPLPTVR